MPTFREALRFWWKLGWISFGGPAGQIAIMHKELVEKRRWLGEDHFLHALNFCMLLPGPEAQQLATYLGWRLHGARGGIQPLHRSMDEGHARGSTKPSQIDMHFLPGLDAGNVSREHSRIGRGGHFRDQGDADAGQREHGQHPDCQRMAVSSAEEDQVTRLGIRGWGVHGRGEKLLFPPYIHCGLPAHRSFSGWAVKSGGLPSYSRLTRKYLTGAPAGITSA